jgi:hypothetical protein
MPLMSRQILGKCYKGPAYPAIVAVSLLLVFLALRVPVILAVHSPRTSSREGIETAVKDSQEGFSRQNFAGAVFHNPVPLDLPTSYRESARRESHAYLFLAVAFFNARAPPAPVA